MSIPSEPAILYSYLNMKLRDLSESLEELCMDLSEDPEKILEKMEKAGYGYDSEENRFFRKY